MVAFPFYELVVVFRMLAMNIIQGDMINVWGIVSTFFYLPRLFLSTDILFERRIWQFTMNLLYIRFTY